MKRLATLLLLAFLAPVSEAAPQNSRFLSATIRAEHLEFIRGEALTVRGEIRNAGPTVLIVDDYGPYRNNAVKFFVRDTETGRLVLPRAGSPASAIPELTVAAGSARPYEVNLEDFYDLPGGRYTVTAAVVRGEEIATSDPVSFTIVDGLELRAVMHFAPNRPERPLRYALAYWSRERREVLFLRVTDPDRGNRLVGFVLLGGVVRVATPSMTFDGNELTIVHQIGRDHFCRTRLDVAAMPPRLIERNDNLLSADALHEHLATRLVEERIDEAAARRERESGGLFERHRTRIPEPTEQPSAIHPVPKE